MSKLLILEPPLQLLPSLAVVIGLNEAIVVQQIHYWLVMKTPDGRKMGQATDGQRWIRNTAENWQISNFPFWNVNTVRRVFANLEERNIITSRDDLNKIGYDRTKWYTINYDELKAIYSEWLNAINQNGEMELPNMVNTIPETTTETTKDIEEEGGNAFRVYEQEIGPLTSMIAEGIEELVKEHTAHWVCESFRICSKNAKRSLGYAESILKRWLVDGYGTAPPWERKKYNNNSANSDVPTARTQ